MRVLSSVVAVAMSAMGFFAASEARADGVILTFKDSNGTAVGPRVALSAFSGGAASTGNGALPTPTTFEIDSDLLLRPLLDGLVTGRPGTAVFESTATVNGNEVAQSIATYSYATVTSVQISLGASGLRTFYTLRASSDPVLTTPGLMTKRGPVIAPRAFRLPTRLELQSASPEAVSVPTVESVYLQVDSLAGDGAGAPNPAYTRYTTFDVTLSSPSDPMSGAPSGHLLLGPMTFTRPHAVTPQLQTAVSNRTSFATGAVHLMHGAGATATPSVDIGLQAPRFKSDTASLANGVNSETVVVVYPDVTLADVQGQRLNAAATSY